MDDRDQELAALKARLAVLEAGGSNGPSAPPPVQPARKPVGCGSVALFATAGALGLMVLVSLVARMDTDKNEPTPLISASCDQDWASKMLTRAQATGIIERMDVKPEGFIAVVNGRLFESLSYSAKEQVAVAIDCQVAGDGKHLSSIHFRRSMHGEDLAEFKAADLLAARQSYAGAGWSRN